MQKPALFGVLAEQRGPRWIKLPTSAQAVQSWFLPYLLLSDLAYESCGLTFQEHKRTDTAFHHSLASMALNNNSVNLWPDEVTVSNRGMFAPKEFIVESNILGVETGFSFDQLFSTIMKVSRY